MASAEMPSPDSRPGISAPERSSPLLSESDVSVIYVLGGPGSGKGTQCARLVRDFGFQHLSAGDLLRAEQDREGSEFGDMIREHIRDGRIVPMRVTIQLLENAILEGIRKREEAGEGAGPSRVLIDGFPRAMDQCLAFEAKVCRSRFTLFLDCPEDVMMSRLLDRGKTSGRADDNVESIKKRFKTFVETSMPVVDYFSAQDKVVKVSAVPDVEGVYDEVRRRFKERGVVEQHE